MLESLQGQAEQYRSSAYRLYGVKIVLDCSADEQIRLSLYLRVIYAVSVTFLTSSGSLQAAHMLFFSVKGDRRKSTASPVVIVTVGGSCRTSRTLSSLGIDLLPETVHPKASK